MIAIEVQIKVPQVHQVHPRREQAQLMQLTTCPAPPYRSLVENRSPFNANL